MTGIRYNFYDTLKIILSAAGQILTF
jgi:hypothetical protein